MGVRLGRQHRGHAQGKDWNLRHRHGPRREDGRPFERPLDRAADLAAHHGARQQRRSGEGQSSQGDSGELEAVALCACSSSFLSPVLFLLTAVRRSRCCFVLLLQSRLSFDPSENANAGDKLIRAQLLQQNGWGNPMDAEPGSSPSYEARGTDSETTPEEALEAGWNFFSLLQDKSTGHWPGDYGGPLFLLPGLVIACFIAGPKADFRGTEKVSPRSAIPPFLLLLYSLLWLASNCFPRSLPPSLPLFVFLQGSAMLTYIRNHQQTDGGWGLHIEGPSTLFPTTLNYLAARLLGLPASDPLCVAARSFVHSQGGAPYMPQWGKFWLACLNLYDWDGVNPMSPELWLLPMWFPFHPSKMWCHSRMCYLPMSFLYGSRATVALNPLLESLRAEIFTPELPYSAFAEGKASWDTYRNTCAAGDLYAPHHPVMDAALWLLSRYERWAPDWLRKNWLLKKSLDFTLRYCEAEDLQTNYCDIGPVNKTCNLLVAVYARGRDSEQLARHLARVDDYLWVAEDGCKMQGYNGSQAWDTSFALQAMSQAGVKIQRKHQDTIARAYNYLNESQIKTDVPQRELYFRTASKGGWPFSTNDHGWPIADCTSEGMKATLAVRTMQLSGAVDLSSFPSGNPVSSIAPERYYQALDVLVALHNDRKSVATAVPFTDKTGTPSSLGDLVGSAVGGLWGLVGLALGAPLRAVDTFLDLSFGWHSFNKDLDRGDTSVLHGTAAPPTAPSVAFNNPPSPWLIKPTSSVPWHGSGAQWLGQTAFGWLGLNRKATDDGGWATYEEKRGGDWYELLNPAEVWGDLMTDYTYTELTSACVTGLASFCRHFPEHRTREVQRMIARGTDYVRAQQRPDGSWYGSWAVCFTYGTWFGVEALIAGGQPNPNAKSLKGKAPSGPYDLAGGDGAAIRRACSFLLSKQRPDGGWGESYLSCLTKQYHHTDSSQVVNTAWALLALIHAQAPEAHAVRRGIDFLISRQGKCGDWPQENVSGIFNRTCSITYTSYRNVFPLWALGAYCNSYKHRMSHPVPLIGSDISRFVPVMPGAAKYRQIMAASASASASSSSSSSSSSNGATAGSEKKAPAAAVSRSSAAAAVAAGTPPGTHPTAVNSRKHARRSKSRSSGPLLTKMADLDASSTSSEEQEAEEEKKASSSNNKSSRSGSKGPAKKAAGSAASASPSSSAPAAAAAVSRRGRAASAGRK